MRAFAALQVVVTLVIGALAITGVLPWWDLAFPLLLMWLCGTDLAWRLWERRKAHREA